MALLHRFGRALASLPRRSPGTAADRIMAATPSARTAAARGNPPGWRIPSRSIDQILEPVDTRRHSTRPPGPSAAAPKRRTRNLRIILPSSSRDSPFRSASSTISWYNGDSIMTSTTSAFTRTGAASGTMPGCGSCGELMKFPEPVERDGLQLDLQILRFGTESNLEQVQDVLRIASVSPSRLASSTISWYSGHSIHGLTTSAFTRTGAASGTMPGCGTSRRT